MVKRKLRKNKIFNKIQLIKNYTNNKSCVNFSEDFLEIVQRKW